MKLRIHHLIFTGLIFISNLALAYPGPNTTAIICDGCSDGLMKSAAKRHAGSGNLNVYVINVVDDKVKYYTVRRVLKNIHGEYIEVTVIDDLTPAVLPEVVDSSRRQLKAAYDQLAYDFLVLYGSVVTFRNGLINVGQANLPEVESYPVGDLLISPALKFHVVRAFHSLSPLQQLQTKLRSISIELKESELDIDPKFDNTLIEFALELDSGAIINGEFDLANENEFSITGAMDEFGNVYPVEGGTGGEDIATFPDESSSRPFRNYMASQARSLITVETCTSNGLRARIFWACSGDLVDPTSTCSMTVTYQCH